MDKVPQIDGTWGLVLAVLAVIVAPVLSYFGTRYATRQSAAATNASTAVTQQGVAFEAYQKVTGSQQEQIEQLQKDVLELRSELASVRAEIKISRQETETERKMKLSALSYIRTLIAAFHTIAGGSAQIPPAPSDIASQI